MDFLWNGMFGLELCSYEFGYPSKQETLINYSGYQEKTEHPMNMVAQASGKDSLQILEATSPQCNTLGVPSKRETRIEYMENQELR